MLTDQAADFGTEQVAALLIHAMQAHQGYDLVAAHPLYATVLHASPREFGALYALGVSHCQRGRYAQGVPFLEQALAVAPDYAEAHCNVASALNALARQQEAVTHAERAVALDPASAEALNILGDALHAVARYDEAILTLHAGPDHSAWAFPAFVDTGSYAASTGG